MVALSRIKIQLPIVMPYIPLFFFYQLYCSVLIMQELMTETRSLVVPYFPQQAVDHQTS